jgi:hypothetical protein
MPLQLWRVTWEPEPQDNAPACRNAHTLSLFDVLPCANWREDLAGLAVFVQLLERCHMIDDHSAPPFRWAIIASAKA